MAGRYNNIQSFLDENKKRYRSNPVYPSIPVSVDDYYMVSNIGDRYDTLALRFYGDSKLWWIIASANVSFKASLVVEPGIQLRIPANKAQAIQLYNQVNLDR